MDSTGRRNYLFPNPPADDLVDLGWYNFAVVGAPPVRVLACKRLADHYPQEARSAAADACLMHDTGHNHSYLLLATINYRWNSNMVVTHYNAITRTAEVRLVE